MFGRAPHLFHERGLHEQLFQEVGYWALHSEMGAIRQHEKDMIIGYESPKP